MNFFLVFMLMTSTARGGVVIKPVANMYSSPSEDADVVSQAIYGMNVGVVEEKTNWVKVRTPDNYTGWMPVSSLKRLDPTDKPYASAGQVGQVESICANLYHEPNVSKRQPVLTVPFETRLEVASESPPDEDRWLEVRLPDNRLAWVQRGDLTFDFKPLTIKGTIALAKRFLGVTYLWGGTSSFGYDCSGFTQMLMRQRGVALPRDASLQAAWDGLVSVNRHKLKPGDLLFFGNSPNKITHTGMYIDHGKFIHDTIHGHPGIQISRLGDRPWSELLVACRRVK